MVERPGRLPLERRAQWEALPAQLLPAAEPEPGLGQRPEVAHPPEVEREPRVGQRPEVEAAAPAVVPGRASVRTQVPTRAECPRK